MPKRRKISEEQIIEIKEARRATKDKKVDKRPKALLLHAAGVGHKEIAKQTEFSYTYVGELVGKYLTHRCFGNINQHHFIFHIAFQQCFFTGQRKCSIFDQISLNKFNIIISVSQEV
jgi:hypothetical protein